MVDKQSCPFPRFPKGVTGYDITDIAGGQVVTHIVVILLSLMKNRTGTHFNIWSGHNTPF